MTADEALIWDCVAEIDRSKRLCDASYAALARRASASRAWSSWRR